MIQLNVILFFFNYHNLHHLLRRPRTNFHVILLTVGNLNMHCMWLKFLGDSILYRYYMFLLVDFILVGKSIMYDFALDADDTAKYALLASLVKAAPSVAPQ